MNNDVHKYRVWDSVEKRYLRECEAVMLGMDGKIYLPSDNKWLSDEQGRYVVERCVGLKDKNDNPIYKGDVVEFDNETLMDAYGDETLVETMNRAVLKKYTLVDFLSNYSYCESMLRDDKILLKEMVKSIKIIGNIYENPELLEGKE